MMTDLFNNLGPHGQYAIYIYGIGICTLCLIGTFGVLIALRAILGAIVDRIIAADINHIAELLVPAAFNATDFEKWLNRPIAEFAHVSPFSMIAIGQGTYLYNRIKNDIDTLPLHVLYETILHIDDDTSKQTPKI